MANKLQDKYFGNYRGIVKKHGINGYCKIFFYGVYPIEYETNIDKLPWAEPASELFAGGQSNNGVFQYPDIDTTVWAFFEAGNINKPIFFAQTNDNKSKFISGESSIQYNDMMLKFDNVNKVLTISNNAGSIKMQSSTSIEIEAPVIKVTGITSIN